MKIKDLRMSAKKLRKLHQSLDDIIAEAREIKQNIIINALHLDSKPYKHTHSIELKLCQIEYRIRDIRNILPREEKEPTDTLTDG